MFLTVLISLTIGPSYSSELDILGFKTLSKVESLDCKFEYVDNWLNDEYHCHIYRSKTDVLEFNSDPYTNVIGRIHRKILVDVDDLSSVYEKIIDRYGEPKDKTPVGNILVWGDSTILENLIVENKKKGGIGLSIQFDKCSSRVKCGLFETYNEDTVIVDFMLFNSDWNTVNNESLRAKEDKSEFVFSNRYGSRFKEILTEDVSKLQL